jgi:hypothetical protein
MKKGAAVHFQLPAAEVPIGAQEEMIPENSVFAVAQHAAADQTEIGHVLFPFARIGPPPVNSAAELQ